MRGRWRRWLFALLGLLATPTAALAHGHEHSGAGHPHALAAPVVVQGFRIEVLSGSGPLALGREAHVIARIWRDAPVIGADVRMSITPAEHAQHAHHDVLTPVSEQQWAGSYLLRYVPAAAGLHDVRVEISEAEGTPLDPPIDVAFGIDVAEATTLPWGPILGAGLIAALTLTAIRLKATGPGATVDLLSLPWLSRILTSPALQPALQIPLLLATAAVVYLGFADVQDPSLNVAPRLTWTIWWAGVIFTLVIVGRVWCVLCPFGALNEWTARLTGAWRRLPRVFRSLWWGTALFLALTWADEQLGVVRKPSVTAWIVVGLAVLAVAVGLRYERRSFCRYLCPIGGMLGLYSMVAPIELRARDAAVCRCHTEKECYRGGAGARGCPMLEFPAAMDRNNYCTFCLVCARSCSRGNLALRARTVGRDLWMTSHRRLDEAYLALLLVGLTVLLTARMLTAWPTWVATVGGRYAALVDATGLLLGALGAAPLLALGAAALADRLAGGARLGVRQTFVQFAYMFVPIALGVHLAHNASHLLWEGPGIVPALERTLATYTPWGVGESDWPITALASGTPLATLQTALMLASLTLSLLAGYRLAVRTYGDRVVASRAVVPFLLLSLLFTVAGLALLAQPMAMRHGM